MEDQIIPELKHSKFQVSIPFEHKDLKNSLQNITSKESNHKPTLLEDMISDKAKNLKSTVIALLEEIQLRENLNSEQFQKIDSEIRHQHNKLMELENIVDHHPFDLTKDLDESRARIESNVLELEREKRSEKLECWRDLMFLKKYLMTSLKDYWDLTRRREALRR